jgi:Hint module
MKSQKTQQYYPRMPSNILFVLNLLLVVILFEENFYHDDSASFFVQGTSIDSTPGTTSTSSSADQSNENQQQTLRRLQVPTLTPTPSPVPTITSYPSWTGSPVPVQTPSRPVAGGGRPLVDPAPSCFSAWNIVQVQGVGDVNISQVQIGDYVQTGNNGHFTQVYGFGHYDPDWEATFQQIILKDEDKGVDHFPSLEITSQHLVFVERNQKQYTIPASDIVVGDQLGGRRVQWIQSVTRRGVYAPLTQSGEIVVSGIRASNYIQVLDVPLVWDQHVYAHALFGPQRWFCYYFLTTCQKETYLNGYGWLAYVTVGIGSSVNHLGWLASFVFSLVCIPLVVMVYAMDMIASVGEGALVIAVGAILLTLFMIYKRTRQ